MVISKKAQVKIQQMIFMLMAVFILFVLIGLIVLSSRLSNIRESATELQKRNALTLVSRLANSPEFSCGSSYGNQKGDCVDLDKVMGLKKNIENYGEFWGVSNIEIRVMPNENISCNEDNYPECDTLKLLSEEIKGNSFANFVSVCHKELNEDNVISKCDIGQIIVSYEVIQ